MKKTFAVILALLMCLACAGCHTEYPYYDMEIEDISNDMTTMKIVIPDKLAILEQHADLIVQGFVQNDAEQVDFNNDPILHQYAMKSSLRITKVYQGNVDVGSTIPILEDWYIAETDEGEKLRVRDGYMPSDPETEYIFFLGANRYDWEGTYCPLDNEVGRFPVPDASTDPACVTERESYRRYIPDNYRSIYAEIIKKYF